jgi:hypothetical protein
VSVLNATVTAGGLSGAHAHHQSQLVDFDPPTSAGTVVLMAGSAG